MNPLRVRSRQIIMAMATGPDSPHALVLALFLASIDMNSTDQRFTRGQGEVGIREHLGVFRHNPRTPQPVVSARPEDVRFDRRSVLRQAVVFRPQEAPKAVQSHD
jgi:hypothetical protein